MKKSKKVCAKCIVKNSEGYSNDMMSSCMEILVKSDKWINPKQELGNLMYGDTYGMCPTDVLCSDCPFVQEHIDSKDDDEN